MSHEQQSGGDAAPPEQREAERRRAYRKGRRARAAKHEARAWLEPHYPAADADLAHSWLEGWADMGDRLSEREGGST